MVVSRRWRATACALTIFAVVLLAACGRESEDGLSQGNTIDVLGLERRYDLYVPKGRSATPDSAPLIVLLHANRSSTDDLTGESRTGASPYSVWRDIADDEGLLLLIPEGVDGPNGHSGWNDCRIDSTGNPDSDDVSFITAALNEVEASHGFDRQRVFATGTSNGGHMAIRLAQDSAVDLAGIAAVAAGMPVNSQCESSDVPVSALFMAGTADPIAPFTGGQMASDRGEILSAQQSVDYWLDRNGLDGQPEVTVFEDLDDGDGSTAERLLYTGGAEGTRVAMYRIEGGGHAEPSISHQYRRVFERVVGNQNHDVEMADEVWAFFKSIDRTPG